MAFIISLQIDFSLLANNFLITSLIFLCSKFRRTNIYLGGLWHTCLFKLTLHGPRNKCKRVWSLGYFVFSVCRFPLTLMLTFVIGSHDSMWQALPFFQAVWKLYIWWWQSYFEANVFPVPHWPVIKIFRILYGCSLFWSQHNGQLMISCRSGITRISSDFDSSFSLSFYSLRDIATMEAVS
jgi:hypothetical protein